MDNCKDDIPNIQFDDSNAPTTCFGMTVPYTHSLAQRLDKLTPEEQWGLMWVTKDWDNGKKLILMRGLPGSGKSTKAKELAGKNGQVFSTDDYFCLNEKQEYRFNGSLLGKAHQWNQRRSLDAMHVGIPIVVIDNTHTTIREMRSYLDHMRLAKQLGYQVRIEEPDTEWKFRANELFARGTHGVPQKHIEKMLNRYVKDVQVEDVLFEK